MAISLVLDDVQAFFFKKTFFARKFVQVHGRVRYLSVMSKPVTESVTEFFFPFPKELSMVEKYCKQA